MLDIVTQHFFINKTRTSQVLFHFLDLFWIFIWLIPDFIWIYIGV